MAKRKGEGESAAAEEKEGRNLLGPPTFEDLENGRLKCLETGHEFPSDAKDSYAQSKHCRLGLIDAALALKKPPLNMFRQDPISRSKLICKLTGDTVNKSEEHIWKHINGRRFLNMLEKKEAEKQTPNGITKEGEQPPGKMKKPKADNSQKKKRQQEIVSKVITEMRESSDKDSDLEETDFWMPPVGDRWDCDKGGDRWGSGSESGPETEEASAEDAAADQVIDDDAMELSKRTKRMSIEIGPSNYASRKKKKKTTPT